MSGKLESLLHLLSPTVARTVYLLQSWRKKVVHAFSNIHLANPIACSKNGQISPCQQCPDHSLWTVNCPHYSLELLTSSYHFSLSYSIHLLTNWRIFLYRLSVHFLCLNIRRKDLSWLTNASYAPRRACCMHDAQDL